jgi:hypothetical protein
MKDERPKDDPTKHVMLLAYLLDYIGSYAYLHRKVVFCITLLFYLIVRHSTEVSSLVSWLME